MNVTEAAERLRRYRAGESPEKIWPTLRDSCLKNRNDDRPWSLGQEAEEFANAECEFLAAEYLRLTDPTPITEDWLKQLGWKAWDCSDGDEFDLWTPANDELGWKCRLAWTANGLYAVRMSPTDDESEYDGPSESVELLDSRNTTKVVTRGQLRMLAAALGIDLEEIA